MLRLEVKGVNCSHCVAALKEIVRRVAPEAAVVADTTGGRAMVVDPAGGKVEASRTDRHRAVVEAIRAAGYEITPAPR